MPGEQKSNQVRRVLLITLILNLLVAISKIVIGGLSGALSITADGIHSLVDGSSNVVALLANRIAAQPPDAEHPYGHQRFETLAALGIGMLLLLAGWEIISGALERLGGGEPPTLTPVAFAVLIGTLLTNVFINRYEHREGTRLNSELLIADAAHTGSDIFVTISVLISMGLVSLGATWADPIAALVIVGFIGRAAWQIIRQTGAVLVDRAPLDPAALSATAETVPSVERVVRARSRGSVDAAHVDLDVQIAPQITTDHAAAIAQAIRAQVTEAFDGVREVEVHFVPDMEAARHDYALAARAQADALGLATHAVRVSDGEDGRVLEMHVEVPPGQTLAEAHARVSQLEQDVQAAMPEIERVVTHIEPALNEGAAADVAPPELREQALALLHEAFPQFDWHDPVISGFGDGYALALHVALPAQTPVESAHRTAEAAELLLRTRLPQIARVTIHTEPPEAEG